MVLYKILRNHPDLAWNLKGFVADGFSPRYTVRTFKGFVDFFIVFLSFGCIWKLFDNFGTFFVGSVEYLLFLECGPVRNELFYFSSFRCSEETSVLYCTSFFQFFFFFFRNFFLMFMYAYLIEILIVEKVWRKVIKDEESESEVSFIIIN